MDTTPSRGQHALGLLYGFLAGLCLSFGGPIVRLMEPATDGWQMLTWRSYAFTVLMLGIALWRVGSVSGLGRNFMQMGWIMLPIALVVGIGQISYLLGLVNTTVANVTFVIGAAPLFTALAAWVLLGEQLSLRGSVLLVMAMGGVTIMVAEGLAGGRLAGNLFALGAMVTYGAYVILLRYARHIDTFAASALGGAIATAIAAFMCQGDIAIPLKDVGLSTASGVIQVGAGFAFATMASRLIPAAEVTLLILIETILGPLWVWALVGEVPSQLTLLGGVVIVGSVAAYALNALLYEKPPGLTRQDHR